MKMLKQIVCVVALTILGSTACRAEETAPAVPSTPTPPPAAVPPARPDFLKTDKDVASYAIGQSIGMQLADVATVIDLDGVVKSMGEAAGGKANKFTDADMQKTLGGFQSYMQEKQAGETKNPPVKVGELPEKEKVSYAIGQYFGTSLKTLVADLDMELLTKSFVSSVKGEKSPLNPMDAQKTVQAYLGNISKKQGEKNLTTGNTFLAENAKKEGVKTTASGLQYKVITEGKGAKPPSAATEVEVHYEGRLLDGTVFDSSIKRNEPATFALNQVIPGWTEGLQLMPEGSKYELYIPSAMAYGEQGRPSIPPNSTLIFIVELLKIKNAEAKK